MIYFRCPFFPPSINNVFFTTRGRNGVPIRVMTSEGKRYKREFKTWLARHHPEALNFFTAPDESFEIAVRLHFQKIYNAGWPKTAKSRHKKIDASNYFKVLEDALVSACGHDDSQHLRVSIMKNELTEREEAPFFELWAWKEDELGPIGSFSSLRDG